jgi:flavin reductase (DIM6/NTAB) family NADH-FMN oxidoreductase RutF
MVIEVDLQDPPLPTRLIGCDEIDELRVRVLTTSADRDWERLNRRLEGLARCSDDGLYVTQDALRRLGGGSDPSSASLLAAAVQAAARRGDVCADGSMRAHVEWLRVLAIEPDTFRHVLGHFPTGVAIVAADCSEGPVGMACNSLVSVSLEPPLIAICPAKTSTTWPKIRDAGTFLINLVGREHAATALTFARRGADRFAAVSYHGRRAGPALDESLAWIECGIVAEHDAGDHTIVLARVLGLEARPDLHSPLVFFRGRYGTFVEDEGS